MCTGSGQDGSTGSSYVLRKARKFFPTHMQLVENPHWGQIRFKQQHMDVDMDKDLMGIGQNVELPSS